MNKKFLHNLIVVGFLSVPILSSIISTFHLYTFFSLADMNWMSIMLAVVFELGSLTSFLALSILDKLILSFSSGLKSRI